MTLVSGARLGPYEILSALGAGGMGEVYRARDGTLQRDVALKILPEPFALDADRLARFRREAQLLASLNHPNIAAIYGFEESTTTHALVLELVDGSTLADRIAQGPIPVAEALPIARQIAEALDAAHEHGIIHRDLKPANIKLRPDGTVKVLDFGLAKITDPPGPDVHDGGDRAVRLPLDLAASPTITSPAMLTGVGMILGTAAYMSPEQARGRQADKRSDIWAFGAVLYEMFTGQRAFPGDDVPDTIANVLKSAPEWSGLPADVPPHVRLLIQRCLEKNRHERIADMSVALFVMSEASLAAERSTAPAPSLLRTPRSLWRRLVTPTAAAIVAGGAVGAGVWFAMHPSAARVTRFALAATGPSALALDQVSRDLSITRDGTQIVYKGTGISGGEQFFVRALDQLASTPLTGLGTPKAPFLSPDGQWIGFVDVGSSVGLKKVAITGGPALPVSSLDGQSRGATWGEDDSIIFATSQPATGLQRVSSSGGQAVVLTTPDRERGEEDHLWPQFLPGSMSVLFTIASTSGDIDRSQVAVLDLRTGTQKTLLQGGSQAQFVASGHLVYAAAGTLRAVAFDLDRLEVIGTPVPVLAEVVTLPTGVAEFDIADDGTLAYAHGGVGTVPARTLVWVDRQGREAAIASAPARPYIGARLSPDGTRVALDIRDQDNDIWVWDFVRETLTRITFDSGIDSAPAWTPDGRHMVFSSQLGGGVGSLFWRAANGSGAVERWTQSPTIQLPSAVSPDGTRVVFRDGTVTTQEDLMMLTLDKEHRVQPLIQTPFSQTNGEISPDGRWLAYQSNESGQFQIVVRPFPGVNDGMWQVSTGGGMQPLWARNSRELFYLVPNGGLMSVRFEPGSAWTASAPAPLLDGPYFFGGVSFPRTYDVSPDGKRFLLIKEAGAAGQAVVPASIVVVQNWTEELKRLVPTR
jgi:eukaryotic-like serine/threonine-protein kinase